MADPRRLCAATTEGHLEAVRALLAGGADPNSKNAKGLTVLQNAVFWSQIEISLLLIEGGGDVTVKDGKGKSLREKMNPKMLEAVGAALEAAEAKADL